MTAGSATQPSQHIQAILSVPHANPLAKVRVCACDEPQWPGTRNG